MDVIAEWKGENYTSVRLTGEIKKAVATEEPPFNFLNIAYCKYDIDQYLEKVDAAVKAEQLAEEALLYGNSDTSGL